MTIEKLSECKNASKYGTCSECGVSEGETHNLYRLKFNGVSVCLCQDCFSKARQILSSKHILNEDMYIPYLMHKEMDIPISECQKAYDVAIEYLRRQGKVSG